MVVVLVFTLINQNLPYSNINPSQDFKDLLDTSEEFYSSVGVVAEQGSSNSTGGFWSGLTSFIQDSFLYKAFNMLKNLTLIITKFYDWIARALGFIGVDPIIKYWIFGLLMISVLVVILRLISRSGFV